MQIYPPTNRILLMLFSITEDMSDFKLILDVNAFCVCAVFFLAKIKPQIKADKICAIKIIKPADKDISIEAPTVPIIKNGPLVLQKEAIRLASFSFMYPLS